MALAIKKSKYLSETGEKEVSFLSLEQAGMGIWPPKPDARSRGCWLRGLTDDV